VVCGTNAIWVGGDQFRVRQVCCKYRFDARSEFVFVEVSMYFGQGPTAIGVDLVHGRVEIDLFALNKTLEPLGHARARVSCRIVT
jgi:hypothetical protein